MGVPSEDTFLRVFSLLNPKQFESCFRQWVSRIIPNLSGTSAVDGKTVRGSGNCGEMAIHMVSAFATRLGVVLGQEKVSAKSNEITAIPELLDALYLKGFPVSIDAPKEVALGHAVGCQRAIVEKIIAKRGDYLLAVKGIQPKLHHAIQDAFLDRKDQVVHVDQAEQAHVCIVAQRCSLLPETGIVSESDWPECAVIARIDSISQVKSKAPSMEQRYHIASRDFVPAEVAEAVRSHWGVLTITRAR